jgi:lysozyme
MNNFTYDPQGLALTEREESLRLIGYLPGPGDVPTNGWGHTGRDVWIGQVINRAQATIWLQEDTANAVRAVNELVKVPLMQNQFDALVDFAFNAGNHAFETSTMLKLLNEGNYAAADADFQQWVFVKGVKNRGLQNRRTAEQQEFQGA